MIVNVITDIKQEICERDSDKSDGQLDHVCLWTFILGHVPQLDVSPDQFDNNQQVAQTNENKRKKTTNHQIGPCDNSRQCAKIAFPRPSLTWINDAMTMLGTSKTIPITTLNRQTLVLLIKRCTL